MAVSYSDVLLNNTSLADAGSGVTAVFVGATAGIGLGALRSLTHHTTAPTIYIVGRSRKSLDSLMASLQMLNSGATFHAVVAKDLTLVADAEKAAAEIIRLASRVDLLIMSPGYIDFSHQVSPEGIDRLIAIRYYSRMRFLVSLAPLLRKSPSPRVVSVLAAGMEGKLFPDDLLLEKNFSAMNAAAAATTMTTLFLEEFSKQEGNDRLVCCHLYPGWVGDTGMRVGNGFSAWLRVVLEWVVAPMMRWVGYTSEEAGERVVFAATNGRFRRLKEGVSGEGTMVQKGVDGRIGGGVYLVQDNSSAKTQNEALRQAREDGMAKRVFDHTMAQFDEINKG
ncbi:uncharacterized protein HMPREF1541_00912 [Cyphellophora europaea CBS 101466]|uniref:Ketoreductase (KR) domain-containing protein n=1 Tax=Cyphellophora europaea (strain CBS 101466) TaxID=1220924 RepID=W2SFA4_CYPE1|nr:uncharacterized protein HMPREF1541_00912 [Cyphellophora europaea CBS 101466]ETN46723.1 hypothetical protein HMPREF1541_00912 [Cyphellophora europaea CBS 101466]